jgi:hypothetical protein
MSLSDRPAGKYNLQGSPGQKAKDLCEDAARLAIEVNEQITIQRNGVRVVVNPDDTPLDVLDRLMRKGEETE